MAMTVGINLAKSVLQVHGVDRSGGIILRRRLSRGRLLDVFAELPPCRIGIEGLRERASLVARARAPRA